VINLCLNPSRTLAKPYKYPLKNKKREIEEKHRETYCEKFII
jgi:hypothetical protein